MMSEQAQGMSHWTRGNLRDAERGAMKKHVSRGEGRAYRLALNALEWLASPDIPEPGGQGGWQQNLYDALKTFGRVVTKHAGSDRTSELPATLNREFDIDSIIDFSGAWEYWENLDNFLSGADAVETYGAVESLPLDQQLFRGTHPQAHGYQDGIERLAAKQAQSVAAWLRLNLDAAPVKSVLDLGAGPGVYACALLNNGVAREATCVDFKAVIVRASAACGERVKWIADDLFELSLPADASYDLIYVGNVFHHYSLADNLRYLERVAGHCADGAYVVVQEYLLADDLESSRLQAAILGLHFALTSSRGRCFTRGEISSVVEAALPEARLRAVCHLGLSDLLLYRCGGA